MTQGDIVARIADPVHVGRVERVVGERVTVRWLGACEMIEFLIAEADLAPAEEWKPGQAQTAQMQMHKATE